MYGLATWGNSYRIIQRRYNANGIFWNDDHEVMKKLKFNLTYNFPRVQLTRCSIEALNIPVINIVDSENKINKLDKNIDCEVAHRITNSSSGTKTDVTEEVVTQQSNNLKNGETCIDNSDIRDDTNDFDCELSDHRVDDSSEREKEPVIDYEHMDQDICESKVDDDDEGKSERTNAEYPEHLHQDDCIVVISSNFSSTIVTDNVMKKHSGNVENENARSDLSVNDSVNSAKRGACNYKFVNNCTIEDSEHVVELVAENDDIDQNNNDSKDENSDTDHPLTPYNDQLPSDSFLPIITEDEKESDVIDTNILHNSIDLISNNSSLLLTDAEKEYFKNIDCELYDNSDSSDSDSDQEDNDGNVTYNNESSAAEYTDKQMDKSEIIRNSYGGIQNDAFNLSDVLQLPVEGVNLSDINIISTDPSLLDFNISHKSDYGNISFTMDILSKIIPLDGKQIQEDVSLQQDDIIYINETDNVDHYNKLDSQNSSYLEICEEVSKISTPIQTVDNQKTSNLVKDQCSSSDNQLRFTTESSLSIPVKTPLPQTSNTPLKKEEKKIISTADETKDYYCRWCDKYIEKFGRHIQRLHKDEPDVKDLFDPKLTQNEKRSKIGKIAHEHMLFHNYEKPDSEDKKGFIVVRRPNRNVKNKTPLSADDFIACDVCHKILRVSNLRHHYSFCQKKESSSNRGRLADSRRLVTQLHPYANDSMKNKILPYMQDDKYKRKIVNDELVILYGNNLTEKYPKQEDQTHIRAKLRNIGKFLWEAESLNPELKNLAILAEPKNIKVCVKATYAVCGANEDLTTMRAPGTAKAIGSVLKSIGEYLRRLYIERQQDDKKKLIKDFLKLVEGEFEIINRRAETIYREKRRLKESNIPSISDINIFQSYLEEINHKSYNNLLSQFNYEDWRKLGETSLLLIQLFNRRRQGELSKTKITSFESYKGIDENSDLINSLSESEKENAKSYVRFVVNAKRDNDGVVLLKNQQVEYLKLFLEYRSMAGVSDENPYLFGLPPTDGHRHRYMQAYMLISKYADQSGVDNPKTLRGTTLRKHLATTCANKNLTDSEVGDVARHLGHSELIHRSHYRDPTARDIIHVSQFLESAIKPRNQQQEDLSFEVNQSCDNSMIDTNTSADMSVVDDSHSQLDICQKPSRQSTNKSKSSRKQRKRKITMNDNTTINCSTPKKSKIIRTRWSPNETDLIHNCFGKYIGNKKYPSLIEIKNFISENRSILQNRTPAQLTTWFSNLYKKKTQTK